MPGDPEFEKLLNRLDGEGAAPAKGGGKTSAPAEFSDSDPNQPPGFFETSSQLAKGLAHGGAILATDVGRLASHLPGGETIRKYVGESGPGAAISDFADQEYGSWAEQAGSWLAQGGAMFLAPELRLGGLAERAYATRMIPGIAAKQAERAGKTFMTPKYTPGEGFAPTTGKIPKTVMTPKYTPGKGFAETRPENLASTPKYVPGKGFVPAASQIQRQAFPAEQVAARMASRAKWPRVAGDVVEGGARGAVAGMVGDPDNPAEGAAAGIAGGVGAPLVGGAFRTDLGRLAGRLLATEGVFYGIHELTGLPYWPLVGPAIVWHTSPLNKALRIVGSSIIDRGGRLIGSIH